MKTFLSVCSSIFLAVWSGFGANVISINFAGGGAGGSTPTALSPAEGAGVVSAAYWNNVAQNVANGSTNNLKDNSGSSTTASISWASDNTWNTTILELNPNFKMMKGYLDNPTHDITVSVSGVPYGNYDVYVYFNDDNTTGGTVGSYSMGTTKIFGKDAGDLFNGSFVRANGTNATDPNAAGNYVLFQGITNANFTLAAHPEDAVHRSPINGLQIVAAASAVAAGYDHSLFLKSDGSLWDMGYNGDGELGDGTYNNTNRPEQIVASNVTAIAGGAYHSLFLKNDGSLWAMGYNGDGELGDGTYNSTNRPEQIVASNVTAIAAGSHSLFLKNDGSLWAMGYNNSGLLGDGTYNSTNRPEQIVASNVTSIAAGYSHSLFLKSDGSLWAMGDNYSGQLGDGTYNTTNRPEQIMASNVTAIAAGSDHSLFLKNGGSLWAMGNNGSGELGDGTYNNTNRPEQIVASNVTAIAAGSHSLFLKNDGSLWAMGYSGFGQLGDGVGNDGTYYSDANRPEQIVASNVTAIAGGAYHSLFLKSDGSLWAMGYNHNGQLGNSTYKSTNLPVQAFPFVQYGATPTSGIKPLIVQFTSSGMDVLGNTIVNWNWNFGDGSTSTAQNPSHTFVTNGIFIPQLLATNIDGARVVGSGPSITVAPPPPPNDLFVNRIQIPDYGGAVSGTNVGATTEPYEQNPLSGYNPALATVWWTWTAPADESISLTTGGGSINTLLAIYTGSSLPSLSLKTTGVGSINNFHVFGNTNYQIQVDGYQGATGPIELNLTYCRKPGTPTITATQNTQTNGVHVTFCASASDATSYQWILDGSFIGSTPSCIEVIFSPTDDVVHNISVQAFNNCGSGPSGGSSVTICSICLTRGSPSLLTGNTGSANAGFTLNTTNCGTLGMYTRWYQMKATNDTGLVTIGTEGSSSNSILAVFTGSFSSPNSLVRVTCDTSSSNHAARVTFNAVQGTTYWIALDPQTNNPTLRLATGFEPHIESYIITNGAFQLQSTIAPPITYRLMATTNLGIKMTNWSTVLTTNIGTNPPYLLYRDTNFQSFPQRFYQLAPGP